MKSSTNPEQSIQLDCRGIQKKTMQEVRVIAPYMAYPLSSLQKNKIRLLLCSSLKRLIKNNQILKHGQADYKQNYKLLTEMFQPILIMQIEKSCLTAQEAVNAFYDTLFHTGIGMSATYGTREIVLYPDVETLISSLGNGLSSYPFPLLDQSANQVFLAMLRILMFKINHNNTAQPIGMEETQAIIQETMKTTVELIKRLSAHYLPEVDSLGMLNNMTASLLTQYARHMVVTHLCATQREANANTLVLKIKDTITRLVEKLKPCKDDKTAKHDRTMLAHFLETLKEVGIAPEYPSIEKPSKLPASTIGDTHPSAVLSPIERKGHEKIVEGLNRLMENYGSQGIDPLTLKAEANRLFLLPLIDLNISIMLARPEVYGNKPMDLKLELIEHNANTLIAHRLKNYQPKEQPSCASASASKPRSTKTPTKKSSGKENNGTHSEKLLKLITTPLELINEFVEDLCNSIPLTRSIQQELEKPTQALKNLDLILKLNQLKPIRDRETLLKASFLNQQIKVMLTLCLRKSIGFNSSNLPKAKQQQALLQGKQFGMLLSNKLSDHSKLQENIAKRNQTSIRTAANRAKLHLVDTLKYAGIPLKIVNRQVTLLSEQENLSQPASPDVSGDIHYSILLQICQLQCEYPTTIEEKSRKQAMDANFNAIHKDTADQIQEWASSLKTSNEMIRALLLSTARRLMTLRRLRQSTSYPRISERQAINIANVMASLSNALSPYKDIPTATTANIDRMLALFNQKLRPFGIIAKKKRGQKKNKNAPATPVTPAHSPKTKPPEGGAEKKDPPKDQPLEIKKPRAVKAKSNTKKKPSLHQLLCEQLNEAFKLTEQPASINPEKRITLHINSDHHYQITIEGENFKKNLSIRKKESDFCLTTEVKRIPNENNKALAARLAQLLKRQIGAIENLLDCRRTATNEQATYKARLSAANEYRLLADLTDGAKQCRAESDQLIKQIEENVVSSIDKQSHSVLDTEIETKKPSANLLTLPLQISSHIDSLKGTLSAASSTKLEEILSKTEQSIAQHTKKFLNLTKPGIKRHSLDIMITKAKNLRALINENKTTERLGETITRITLDSLCQCLNRSHAEGSMKLSDIKERAQPLPRDLKSHLECWLEQRERETLDQLTHAFNNLLCLIEKHSSLIQIKKLETPTLTEAGFSAKLYLELPNNQIIALGKSGQLKERLDNLQLQLKQYFAKTTEIELLVHLTQSLHPWVKELISAHKNNEEQTVITLKGNDRQWTVGKASPETTALTLAHVVKQIAECYPGLRHTLALCEHIPPKREHAIAEADFGHILNCEPKADLAKLKTIAHIANKHQASIAVKGTLGFHMAGLIDTGTQVFSDLDLVIHAPSMKHAEFTDLRKELMVICNEFKGMKVLRTRTENDSGRSSFSYSTDPDAAGACFDLCITNQTVQEYMEGSSSMISFGGLTWLEKQENGDLRIRSISRYCHNAKPLDPTPSLSAAYTSNLTDAKSLFYAAIHQIKTASRANCYPAIKTSVGLILQKIDLKQCHTKKYMRGILSRTYKSVEEIIETHHSRFYQKYLNGKQPSKTSNVSILMQQQRATSGGAAKPQQSRNNR
jgi:hypothetical protein